MWNSCRIGVENINKEGSMKSYVNYHCHSHYSNITIADSGETVKGYVDRINELGHKAYVSTEHGHSAEFVEKYLACKKNGLKFVYGMEVYLEYNDKTYHMIMMAKNENGKIMMNRMLYEASRDNFKNKRAKLTLDIIKKYDTKDIVVTNACIGGLFKEDTGSLVEEVYDIFKDNFWIEVAPHAGELQVNINKKARAFADSHGLMIVSANDSHYADPKKSYLRNDLLEAKRIFYSEDSDESFFYMDYPDYDTLVNRYVQQGLFTKEEAELYIDNTNKILEFDDIHMGEGGPFKVPTLYPNLNREERCKVLISIINQEWDKYKPTVPEENHNKYINEIKRELIEIFKCKMEDYFLTVRGIIQLALRKGGVLTKTSRGSSSSFFVNMLLGFTTVDRLTSHVPILMERFMTADRILAAKSSPDIDANVGNPEPFIEAQRELLGEGHSLPMIAYGLLKPKSAFKMMCKANGNISVELQNKMTTAIDKFELDLKHAEEEEKAGIRLENYLDNDELYQIYKKGEEYFGIVSDCKRHACGHLIANENLIDKFGVIISPKGDLCLNLQGKYADDLGYTKIDWLTVSVVDLTDKIYKEIGIEQPSAPQLYKLVEYDGMTWDVYEKGMVQCVNQVEKPKTREKVMRYKPRSVEDLCAFIAAIRPGFSSYYKKFEDREDFRFGVDELDTLLRGEYLDGSFLLYQEQIMQILAWVGFEPKRCYEIMKGIGKKKLAVVQSAEEMFKKGGVERLLKSGVNEDKAHAVIESLWRVVLDNASYGFNSSHSYSMAHDSLYIAYAKAHYPLETYKVCIEYHSQRKEKDKVAKLKKEAEVFGIKILPMRFRQDNRGTVASKEKKEIYQNLMSTKEINSSVADILYELKDTCVTKWNELYMLLVESGLNKTQIEALIKINYFEEFGSQYKQLWYVNNFKRVKSLSKAKIKDLYSILGNTDITIEDFEYRLEGLASKITDKQMRFDDDMAVISMLFDLVEDMEIVPLQKIYWESSFLGAPEDDLENGAVGKITKISIKPKKVSFVIEDFAACTEYWITYKGRDPSSLVEKDMVFISRVIETESKSGYVFKSCEDVISLTSLFDTKKIKKED